MLAKSKTITIECTINDINELPETTLGERVKKLRLSNNLNIKELSILTCLSEETISKIEKSLTTPNITTLTKLSQALISTNTYLLNLNELPEITHGEIIYKYRMMKGLSQRALAKLCNINQSTIKDYENNKIAKPSILETIYKNIDYK